MKKKIFLPILVIIVIMIPVINGIVMEKTIKTMLPRLKEINEIKGTDISIKLEKYTRNLYSTDIQWKIDLGMLKDVYGIDSVIINDHAKHGFLSVTANSNLLANPWYKQFVDTYLGGKDPLSISTKYSLLGQIESKWTSTPVHFTWNDESFELGASSFTVITTRKLDSYKTTGDIASLTINKIMTMKDIAVSSDITYESSYIWPGKMDLSVGSMTITDKGESVSSKNMKFHYSFDHNSTAKQISFTTALSADSFSDKDQTIRDITGELDFNNIDSDGYNAFVEQYISTIKPIMMMAAQMKDEGNVLPQEMQSQLSTAGIQLLGSLEKLLKKDLQLKISNVSVTLPQGKIEGNCTLTLLKDMRLIEFIPLASQPKMFMDIFSLSSSIRLPADLIPDTPELTTPVYPGMKTGLFVKDGDILKHDAKTKDGKLILNGEEVSFQ